VFRHARAVSRTPAEFGVPIPAEKEVRVWDSSAQIRWFVILKSANTDS
jgi:nitrile hydratase